jgi:hypothetical protein
LAEHCNFPGLEGDILATKRTGRADERLGLFFSLLKMMPADNIDELTELNSKQKLNIIRGLVSPARAELLVLRHPNLMAVAMASSSLLWNVYSLLTPIQYVLNPRLPVTLPVQSGLFYGVHCSLDSATSVVRWSVAAEPITSSRNGSASAGAACQKTD